MYDEPRIRSLKHKNFREIDEQVGMTASSDMTRGGKVEVFTFKRGVLSRLAHDLRLRLGRFELETPPGKVTATFWPASLEVVGVERGGQTDQLLLSAAQCSEIQQNIRDRILLVSRHPTITFSGVVESRSSGARVAGNLDMVGRSVPLEFPVELRDGRITGEVVLQPTHWGIAPFRALMGAIQLEDRVVVRFDFPALPSS
jgi:hypothetical protein